MGGKLIKIWPQIGVELVPINVAKEILTLSKIILIKIYCIITSRSGMMFRRNVIDETHDVETAKLCQLHCQDMNTRQERYCEYYIWEEETLECVLYTGIKGVEYDNDEDKKCIGHVDLCMAYMCERSGWDYVKTGSGFNIVQYGAIYDIEDIQQCLQICRLTPDCYFVR